MCTSLSPGECTSDNPLLVWKKVMSSAMHTVCPLSGHLATTSAGMWPSSLAFERVMKIRKGAFNPEAPTNDLLGRRTSKNEEQYGYNVRNELIAADEVSYAYDDVGLHAPTSGNEMGNCATASSSTIRIPLWRVDKRSSVCYCSTFLWIFGTSQIKSGCGGLDYVGLGGLFRL